MQKMICLRVSPWTHAERGMSPLVKPLRDQEFNVLEVRGRDSEAAPGEKWSARWGLGLQGSCKRTGRGARPRNVGLAPRWWPELEAEQRTSPAAGSKKDP